MDIQYRLLSLLNIKIWYLLGLVTIYRVVLMQLAYSQVSFYDDRVESFSNYAKNYLLSSNFNEFT